MGDLDFLHLFYTSPFGQAGRGKPWDQSSSSSWSFTFLSPNSPKWGTYIFCTFFTPPHLGRPGGANPGIIFQVPTGPSHSCHLNPPNGGLIFSAPSLLLPIWGGREGQTPWISSLIPAGPSPD